MKKKYSRILGVGLALMLLASLFGFAAPVSADNVKWSAIGNPGNMLITGLNIADCDVGPIAVTPDGGTLFAAVETEAAITGVSLAAGQWAVLQSTDGGHNWTVTGLIYNAGPITGIAVSSNFATDGTMYVAAWSGTLGTPAVFASKNSGTTFTEIKAVTDEAALSTPTTAINSIDMWPASPYPYVMVGTDTDVWVLQDAPFGVWLDQEVNAAGPVNITAVAFAPDFADTNYTWAVTAAGVVTCTNSPGAWGTILGNTLPLAAVVNADIGFVDGYSSVTSPYLWVGLDGAGLNPAGAGVYRVRGLPGLSQAIQQLAATDIRSVAVSGSMAAATIMAGQENAAAISKSTDGGITWIAPVFKQPTGGGVTYVVMAPDFATSSLAYVGTSDFAVITPGAIQTGGSAAAFVTIGTTAPTVTPASGANMAELIYVVGDTVVYVEFVPNQGLTLSDLDTIGATNFLYQMVTLTSGGPNMELRFTMAGYSDVTPFTGHADVNVQVMPAITPDVWATEDVAASTWSYTYFNDPVDGTGGSVGAPGDPQAGTNTIGQTLARIDAHAVMTAHGSSAADWELTRVRIDMGWGGGTRTCYIDDVTIDGVTYQMEPPPVPADSSAFQVSRNAGMSFNQTGLIDTTFTAINDIAVVSLDTIFMVSDASNLWKTEDATALAPVWERIMTGGTVLLGPNTLAGNIALVETSPGFATDGVVYATNNTTGVVKATDGGDIFSGLPATAVAITCLHVVDATFAFHGATGQVYRTDDGAYSWLPSVAPPVTAGNVVSIATAPDYAPFGQLLVGDTLGGVFMSANGGITFDAIPGTTIGGFDTYVAFDPGYATNMIMYAAGGATIVRLDLTKTLGWEAIGDTPTAGATVVADLLTITYSAAADNGLITVLTGSVLVTPTGTATIGGVTSPGTLAISAGMPAVPYTLPLAADTLVIAAIVGGTSGTWTSVTGNATAAITDAGVLPNATCGTGPGVATYPFSLPDAAGVGVPTASTINGLLTSPDGTLYASNFLAGQGVERSLNPTASSTAPAEAAFWPVWERMNTDLPITATLGTATTPASLELVVDETLTVVGSKNVFFAIDTTGASPAFVDRIMTFTDTLATPVVLTEPEDGTVYQRLTEVKLRWETLTGALFYNWMIAEDAWFIYMADSGLSMYPYVTSRVLSAGQTYYWTVRVNSPLLSRLAEDWSFTTELGGRLWHPFSNIGAVAPGPGAQDVLTKPVFQWNGADWATSYEFMLADNADFTGATTKTLTTTSWVSDTDLGYSTTWYWKVRALSATSESEWSDVGVFTTVAEPVEATPPVVIQDVPDIIVEAPDITVEEVTPTPTWALLVIIIIGAVLVISVIILIMRTRRPI